MKLFWDHRCHSSDLICGSPVMPPSLLQPETNVSLPILDPNRLRRLLLEMGPGKGTSIDIMATILTELSPRRPPDIFPQTNVQNETSSGLKNPKSPTSTKTTWKHGLHVREELYDDGSRGMEVVLSLNQDGSLEGEAYLWSGSG